MPSTIEHDGPQRLMHYNQLCAISGGNAAAPIPIAHHTLKSIIVHDRSCSPLLNRNVHADSLSRNSRLQHDPVPRMSYRLRLRSPSTYPDVAAHAVHANEGRANGLELYSDSSRWHLLDWLEVKKCSLISVPTCWERSIMTHKHWFSQRWHEFSGGNAAAPIPINQFRLKSL